MPVTVYSCHTGEKCGAMSSSPYFLPMESHGNDERRVDPSVQYRELTQSAMYALADNALQAHQERSQLEGLVEAASAAADEDDNNRTPNSMDQWTPVISKHAQSSRRSHSPRKSNSEGDALTAFAFDSHPASSLFRLPSSSSKKYTRPPMSKLFSSLGLSPENFLQLQSEAKTYMLDESFPDRRETVGVRGKGDSELVKLKLWNCVKDFLDHHGNGVRFFGPHVATDERTMIWPADKNKIISATTPLLRRIITNERQRQYALETRSKAPSTGSFKRRRAEHDAPAHPQAGVAERIHADLRVENGPVFKEVIGSDICHCGAWGDHDNELLVARLRSLGAGTGLPQDDFNDIVTTIDYHIRMHTKSSSGLADCSEPCKNGFIQRIVSTGLWDHGSWRCGFEVNSCQKIQL